jgi:hypothetical protein
MSEEVELVPDTEHAKEEPLDLQQSNPQIHPRAFWYRVKDGDTEHQVTILAPSSSDAQMGIRSKFINMPIHYLGVSDIIMQVNG